VASRQLFRQQAVDFQRSHNQWGTVASLQPIGLTAVSWLIVASGFAALVFVWCASYSRKETAVGYLTPSAGTAKIFVSRPSTIKAVHVKDGDEVQAGDHLLSLDVPQLAGDGSDINAALITTLDSQREELTRNIAAETERTSSEEARLTTMGDGLKAELKQLQGQLEIQKERLDVVSQELAAGSKLASKGFLTAQELRKRQIVELEHKQSVSSISQRIAAKTNELKEAQFNLAQLPTVMQHRVQALRNQLAEVMQRATEVQGRRAQVIRAPVNGRVTTLQAKPGQNAEPTRLQLEIVPTHSELQAELLVPARAIGFVEVGQPVRILYDAFPYQHFGTHRGKIVSISQTLINAANAAGPIAFNQPAYRVVASLESLRIQANGKSVPLQPDMLLRADIILERRTLLSWLLQPLRSVRM